VKQNSLCLPTELKFCGRALTNAEVEMIRQVLLDFPALSQTELAHTICELLQWRRQNGKLKSRECAQWLRSWQGQDGLPPLPALRQTKPHGAHRTVLAAHEEPIPVCDGPLALYQPLQLQLITTGYDRRQFQHYLQSNHPLGYRVPYGAQLRYFVRSQQPPFPILACLLFTSAAWRMAPRDTWIGWSEAARKINLPLVVNNSRFLILPGVKIPHLASHVLALAARRLASDWQSHYGVRPVLLETLVDRPYAGTCYRAANWILVGKTKGRGRMDHHHQASGTCKDILVFRFPTDGGSSFCTSNQLQRPLAL
jgi:hypothetical protein